MSRVIKRTIKWGLLAIVAYLVIGWIVKDIYFSIYEWQPDETLIEVWRREIKVYTIVAAVIAGFFVLVGCEDFRERYINIPTGIFIVIFMGKDYVPMSIGISLLINLLNIVAMIIPIYGNIINIENRKKNGWK